MINCSVSGCPLAAMNKLICLPGKHRNSVPNTSQSTLSNDSGDISYLNLTLNFYLS